MPLSAITFVSNAAEPDKVLFSSSFELGEAHSLKESKLDGSFLQNVSKVTFTSVLEGSVSPLIKVGEISGTRDFDYNENKTLLFDDSTATKFLTETKPSQSNPVWVSFELDEAKVIRKYAVASANDEPARDPSAWRLLASTNGSNWVQLDVQTNVSFSGRQKYNFYDISNNTAYKFYRFEITANKGSNMTQLSELVLATGEAGGDEDTGEGSPLTSKRSRGPRTTWGAYVANGWTGDFALEVYGAKSGQKAYARNVLFENLNIPVTKNTNFSYLIFPSLYDGNTYDFDYTQLHFIIDLHFTDGTYLSDLRAVDQNGNILTPVDQAKSDTLFVMQWNYLVSNIGQVANGKTIDKILVYFRTEDGGTSNKFLAYFDDIKIENKAPVVYEHLSDYVNILRGTNNTTSFSRGLTTPFVTMPHGFNFYAPVTTSHSSQPYMYQLSGKNNTLRHMTITHVPSTWIGDYGTWQFMPNTSVNISSASSQLINADNRKAEFKHENEIAKAHYYSVIFDEGSKASGVRMEVTPTSHAMYGRFTFPANSENANIIFDCERANGYLKINSDGSFEAYSDHTRNGSVRMYVYGKFDQKLASSKVYGKQGIVAFEKGTTVVTMKLATSFISIDQAKKNLLLEIGTNDTFDTIFAKAQKTWDDLLGIIEIEGATHDQMVTFYSNMYRLFSYPNLYSENEGTNDKERWVYASPYSGGQKKAGIMYVNNGFWDTYRNTWAAYALLTPTQDSVMLDGFVQHYVEQGWIPRWIAPGGANSMVGTSSDIIFADAIVKGIKFNYNYAFQSMLRNGATVSNNLTNGGRAENETAPFIGYVSNATNNGFSWTIEGFINDFGIAVMAEKLGYKDEAAYYMNRAMKYVNLFNKNYGFFMGKNMEGGWSTPSGFNPASWWGDYAETNAWNMSFSIVYDGNGLANLYGGKQALANKLDQLFNDNLRNTVTGTIHEMREAREVRLGQYGHSNQPSHHLPYMYNYAGQPYKTQKIVRSVLSRLYVGSDIGQGYLGDEDNGEMSAWYIFSALGFYPVTMGTGEYAIGSPLFSKATIHLENGKDLVIIAENNSKENIYVQSVTLNGTAYNKNFITHEDLINGGTLKFVMGKNPSNWGTGDDAVPTSVTKGDKPPVPYEDLLEKETKITATLSKLIDAKNTTLYFSGKAKNEIGKLFDNTSKTAIKVEKGDEVILTSNGPQKITIYTVTSSSKSKAPSGFKLEASNDLEKWITLDERTKENFRWDLYTRPFSIDESKQGMYMYYRLTFDGSGEMEIAELEFIGTKGTMKDLTEITDETESETTTETEPETTPSEPEETTEETEPSETELSETDKEKKSDSNTKIILIITASVVGVAAICGTTFAVIKKKKK